MYRYSCKFYILYTVSVGRGHAFSHGTEKTWLKYNNALNPVFNPADYLFFTLSVILWCVTDFNSWSVIIIICKEVILDSSNMMTVRTIRLTAAFFWLDGTTNTFWICIMAAMVMISMEQPKFPDSSSILANMGLRGNSAMRTPTGSVRRPYWSRPKAVCYHH